MPEIEHEGGISRRGFVTGVVSLIGGVIASIIGRGARFYLVAGLIRWGGKEMEQKLRRYIDRIGWAVVGLIVVGVLIYHFR